MRKVLPLVFASPLLIILVLIIMINVNLHYQPVVKIDKRDTLNLDLIKELRGLKQAIDNGADKEMQQIHPEGYVFLNAIYALAWCNLIENLNHDSEYYKEGLSEIEKCWSKINSDEGRSQFEEELPLAYGAFYSGWNNYLLGRKLQLESFDQRDPVQVKLFKENCERIAEAIKANTYPVSYYAQAWPADVVMCVASLALHDKLFAKQYKGTIKVWIADVKKKVDKSGLIPHAVNPSNGTVQEPARGSSQSLMLVLLHEIDKDLAADQFKIYKDLFLDKTFGLTGIREYPKDQFGIGDVDSGPVLMGYGGAATIVGMQTLSVFGERGHALKIRNGIEGMAIPISRDDTKNYFFGLMPIADAFVAWGHGNMIESENENPSFIEFHLYSSFIFLLLSIFFWVLIRPRKPDSKETMTVTW